MKEQDEFAERLARIGEALELSRGYRSQLGHHAAALFGLGASLIVTGLVLWVAATWTTNRRDYAPSPVGRLVPPSTSLFR